MELYHWRCSYTPNYESMKSTMEKARVCLGTLFHNCFLIRKTNITRKQTDTFSSRFIFVQKRTPKTLNSAGGSGFILSWNFGLPELA